MKRRQRRDINPEDRLLLNSCDRLMNDVKRAIRAHDPDALAEALCMLGTWVHEGLDVLCTPEVWEPQGIDGGHLTVAN